MREIVFIGIGGACGAILRFLFSRFIQGLWNFTFPMGTFVVNMVGAFLMGFLSLIIFERVETFTVELRALLLIGLLGGFTTFSTFAWESMDLWQNGEWLKMLVYVFLSVGLSLFAIWGGMTLARKL